ncbi:MAG: hypothetical protein JW941_09745 [Candidatus Coatesbacteria bacterium]|nr:hypothetical protein [Candidatus Coatesbacteria bacterium]
MGRALEDMIGRQQTALTILILLFALVAFHFINSSTDDAFITFRYAENEATGKGLVFNTGERVEGYSNFLFAQILSLLVYLNLSEFAHGLLIWSKALGLFSGLLCVLIVRKSSRLLSDVGEDDTRPLLIVILAPLLLCASPQFVAWTVGGLETSFCALLVAKAQYYGLKIVVGRGSRVRDHILFSLLFFLASITRPEIPILYLAALSMVFFRTVRQAGSFKRMLINVAAYSIPFAGFIAWRYSYYGDIFPNTFYAKATGGGAAQFWDGLEYFGFGIATIFGPFIFLCLSPIFINRKRELEVHDKNAKAGYWFLLWQLVAMSAFIIYSGGDWMGSYRLFMPVIPAVVLLVQFGTVRLWDRLGEARSQKRSRRSLYGAIIVTIIALIVYHVVDIAVVTGSPSGYLVRDLLNREYYSIACMMREEIPPNSTVALGEAGLIPYYSKLKTIDMRGLMDRYIAHLEGEAHAKFEPMYIFRRKPNYLLLVDVTGQTWSEHNYQNMLLDHEVLNVDYELVGDEAMLDLFHKYRFILYRKR